MNSAALTTARKAARLRLQYEYLHDYARGFWHIAQPGCSFIDCDYMRVMCAEVQNAMETPGMTWAGMTPPRCAKSTLVRVLATTHKWLREPGHQFISISNSAGLAGDDSMRARDVVMSPEYRQLAACAGVDVRIRDDQNEKTKWVLVAGGKHECIGVDSISTGKNADTLILDDLFDAIEVQQASPQRANELMDKMWSNIQNSWTQRFKPQPSGGFGRIISIAQSVHPRDPNHRFAETGARVVCLPMEYDPLHPMLFAGDFRTAPGQLLVPLLRNEKYVAAERAKMFYQTQYQQMPTEPGGVIFKKEWMDQEYTANPHEVPCEDRCISIDTTFKKKESSDFVAMTCWGTWASDNGIYLLDIEHDRMGYIECRDRAAMMGRRWPGAHFRVELSANGCALKEDLEAMGFTVVGVIPRNIADRKRIDALSITSLWESRRIKLPTIRYVEKINVFKAEVLAFGSGIHDDLVDSMTQALMGYKAMPTTDYAAANVWLSALG